MKCLRPVFACVALVLFVLFFSLLGLWSAVGQPDLSHLKGLSVGERSDLQWIAANALTDRTERPFAAVAEWIFGPVLERLGMDGRPGDDSPQLPNGVYAHSPSRPVLALDEEAPAVAAEDEVDASVRSGTPVLADRVAPSSVHLRYQTLELLP